MTAAVIAHHFAGPAGGQAAPRIQVDVIHDEVNAAIPEDDVHPADVRLAYSYVRRFGLALRAPDALHLAITHRLNATLVTLDRRLERAARELGIAVEVPQTK